MDIAVRPAMPWLKRQDDAMSTAAFATETSVELAEAYVTGGDPAAADRLYHRHRHHMLQLAASGMSERLQVRIDPEDVYQSVSLILFRGLRHGQFRLTRAGDLRALLVQLTQRRIQKKVEHNQAAKRSLNRETHLVDSNTQPIDQRDPTNGLEEEDEIESLIARIPNPRHQNVIRLALKGMTICDVASRCRYSAARVRQILRSVTEPVLTSDS